MGIFDSIRGFFGGSAKSAINPTQTSSATDNTVASGGQTSTDTERGRRPTPENQTKAAHAYLTVDYALRATIQDIRMMDRSDGRVKRVLNRVARDVTRGGLVMQHKDPNSKIAKEWDAFRLRLNLHKAEKLKSDARGLIMEGNLPYQWVADPTLRAVVAGVRMPSETIRPNVGVNGRFVDVSKAYTQMDLNSGNELCHFGLWQLTLARLDPDNYDDMLCMGRPFIDASREVWRKLNMTDTDLVIRRKHRSPLRLSHVLENATESELNEYQAKIEANKDLVTTDFYQNKKGAVTAVQGDANLGDIEDVLYLLDTFFAGTPLPKGLMGYTDGMARDILEDLKRDYYDEVDQLQDILADVYRVGFTLHLLLKGLNPDSESFTITFKERRTETLSQTTDRGLKLKALGLPQSMVWEELGYNAAEVEERRTSDSKNYEPYPDGDEGGQGQMPKVTITERNAPKGDSATDVKH